MAKRGRPRKIQESEEPNVENKVEETKVEEVSEPKVEGEGFDSLKEEKKDNNYNPFSDNIEEKPYRTPDVASSPMIEDLSEPTFEKPTFEDVLKANQEENNEANETPDPLHNEQVQDMPDKEKMESAAQLVEQVLALYSLGCKGMGSLAKINPRKLDKLAQEGEIDLSLRVPVDRNTFASIPQIVHGFNSDIQDAFEVTEEFNEKVRPPMQKVFAKRGWGVTDEQSLLLHFGMDMAQKVSILMKLRKQGDLQLKKFIEMTDKAREGNVKYTTADAQNPTPPPPPTQETKNEEKNKEAESKMVAVQNPDIKVNKHDLDQIDVDNV